MPIGLFGNKCDLVDERKVTQEEIDEFCQKENIDYFETSAKEKIGISEGFEKIAALAFQSYGSELQKGQKLNSKKKKKKGFC